MKYQNVINYLSLAEAEINYQKVPYDQENNYKDTNKSNVFSDNGAWHGYYLPIENKTSFSGPLVLSQEVPINIGPYSNKINIFVNNKEVIFNNNNFDIYSLPGRLIINIDNKQLNIQKTLIFIDGRQAFINTKITNKTKEDLEIDYSIETSFYEKIKTKSSNNDPNEERFWYSYFKKVEVNKKDLTAFFDSVIDKKVQEKLIISYDKNIINSTKTKKDNQIIFSNSFEKVKIKSKNSFEINSIESFSFNDDHSKKSLLKFEDYSKENTKRWNGYLKISLLKNKTEIMQKQIVKAIQTLVGNWRSPAGVITKNFIIPSITYQDFIGAWSWDTWKIAAGFAIFDPILAQEFIEAMFDYQIPENDLILPADKGMVPDCIFFNFSERRNGVGGNWNERNTKPPIASWAVLKIFNFSKDIKFLKRIYPKLVKYNNWWNENRSLNKDCVLQYGATTDPLNDFNDHKTIIEAASWESGMDNAPRFDWDRSKVSRVMENNKLIGYVIDQISIDLNAFNYLDFISLEKISSILEKDKDTIVWKDKKNKLKKFINLNMYDDQTKFYYDIKANTLEKVISYGKGMEGFIPLFAKVASQNTFDQIIKKMNSSNFFSYLPFPSVALDNERFNALEYWRGPVWFDQLYFGLKALNNYNNNTLAKKLIKKTICSSDGFFGDDPIRENYNPLNGDGLATTNFSWSSSCYLMIIREIIDNKK